MEKSIPISYLSNIEGSIHRGFPKNSEEELLRKIENNLLVGGTSPLIRTLLSIGKIVYNALEPLQETNKKIILVQ